MSVGQLASTPAVRFRFLSWSRVNEGLAWLLLQIILILFIPLFLRAPLTPDAGFYDLCARSVLRGGVHYREVFDSNLPGIVWIHLLIRSLFGWSSEVLRLADLLVVTSIVALLVRLPFVAERSRTLHLWLAVWCYAFYFSTSEVCHCQRDTWMLLFALLAFRLRIQAVVHSECMGMRRSLLEGMFWACGFWIKPFIVVIGLPVLLWGWVLLRRRGATWTSLACDGLGVLLGGVVVGALGIAWLMGTGSWPYFLDLVLHWMPEYQQVVVPSWGLRRFMLFKLEQRFFPWSLLHLALFPLGFLAMRESWRKDRESVVARALFAILTLAWLLQALLLQVPHLYVFVPTFLLAMPLLVTALPSARRPGLHWAAGLLFGGWVVACHPLRVPERLALWSRCLRESSNAELRDLLAMDDYLARTDWQDLARVEDYLRTQKVHGNDVLCFHLNTRPLLLDLDLDVGSPYVAYLHSHYCPSDPGAFLALVNRDCSARYLVSDLRATGLGRASTAPGDPADPPALPAHFPRSFRSRYPWTEPIVFRSGRYVVQRKTMPIGPYWYPGAARPH